MNYFSVTFQTQGNIFSKDIGMLAYEAAFLSNLVLVTVTVMSRTALIRNRVSRRVCT